MSLVFRKTTNAVLRGTKYDFGGASTLLFFYITSADEE
jgi:hypothetical protein